MNWKTSPPAIEIAAEWIAAACLGGAVGFAVTQIAPFAAGIVVASVMGLVVALVAGFAVGQIDRRRGSRGQPIARDDSLSNYLLTEDVLLLYQPIDDVLLLDDPLPAVDGESRVVRLFDMPRDGIEAPPSPLTGPGEMVARIEDYLGLSRVTTAAPDPMHHPDRATSDDASAALHAALADIRRSLRQA